MKLRVLVPFATIVTMCGFVVIDDTAAAPTTRQHIKKSSAHHRATAARSARSRRASGSTFSRQAHLRQAQKKRYLAAMSRKASLQEAPLPPVPGEAVQPEKATPTKVATAKVAATKAAPQWQPAQLVIPDIYIDAPVVRGVSDAALRNGVGHDPLSNLPGQKGNCVIAGHRNVWGAWFWHLPRLKPGSLIYMHLPQKRYTYRVAFTRTVQPHDTSLLEAPKGQAVPRLTLYTCTKPKTENRFVVVANLVSETPFNTAPVASTPVVATSPPRAQRSASANTAPLIPVTVSVTTAVPAD
jgi:LPXTG-site transpeptidase (sortase) family protein